MHAIVELGVGSQQGFARVVGPLSCQSDKFCFRDTHVSDEAPPQLLCVGKLVKSLGFLAGDRVNFYRRVLGAYDFQLRFSGACRFAIH